MEKGYRVPDIKEFVQGFKFQKLETIKSGFIIEGKTTWSESTYWFNIEVWWKHNPTEQITSVFNGNTITTTGSFVNFFSPYSDKILKKLIKEGKIRTKDER